jgi:pimeloyl-ACP methyl ester carboxylesterase
MATSLHLQKTGRALLIGLLCTSVALAEPTTLQTDVEWTIKDRNIFGTMVQPVDQPRAGVLFIAGSGPTDRNWENKAIQGSNGSGRLLADALGNVAIASIRFDKMGSGKTAVPESFLNEDFRYGPEDYLSEVEAALRQLRSVLDQKTPIFLAGHSEGGLWALELNRRHPETFAGIILLATAARSQCEIVQSQLRDRLKEYDLDPQLIEKETGLFEGALARVAKGEPVPATEMPSLGAMKNIIAAYTSPKSAALGRWLCGTDPLSLLPQDSSHVLILQGGYDQQVDPENDAKVLHQAALGSSFTLAPQADHVLKHLDLEGQPLNILHTLKYNQEGRQVDPILMDALLQWIDHQVEN